MSLQKVLQNLQTMKRCHLPTPNTKIASTIISIIQNTSASQPLPPTATALLSNLTPNLVHLILSDPHIKPSKSLILFNFLQKNPSIISFKIDLEAHLTLISRLIRSRKFTEAENLVISLSNDENLRYPFAVIASFVANQCSDSRIVAKLFNLMLKVHSDNRSFELALEIFDYMRKNGIEINERTCTIHLIAVMKCDQVELGIEFFSRMVESGIEVSVFSLTVVVDGLCKIGEISKGRELVEEMAAKGVKPNIITCNTLVDACAKRWNFGELDLVLVLMEKEGVEFNVETFKFLIDGYSSSGKIEEAQRIVSVMHDKGLKVESHLYSLIISGYCRLGKMESAFSLFNIMNQREICPNIDVYQTLVSGLCKIGEMEAAMEILDEMQNREFGLDQAMFDTWLVGSTRFGEGVHGRGRLQSANHPCPPKEAPRLVSVPREQHAGYPGQDFPLI
ncbi:hypothetical protein RJ640_004094 [Escallonia rubra]|uniref:Pentatricopeptide repeat-containing protein n=1 Tax=Escallonia rubra TaxID=112253 RepID=A0AA88RGW3_9ASTE|nr:hypothetical protein RJ640_004094 [Escallonia rubra]